MSTAAVAHAIKNSAVRGAKHWPHKSPALTKLVENNAPLSISPEHDLPMGCWSSQQIRDSVTDHTMVTWAPGKSRHNIPIITHGEGVYLFDDQGNKFLDWTSQAVCSNLGYDLPDTVIDATMKQMKELPFVYSGLGIIEIRARLAKLLAEILPGDLDGFVFPSSGSEANEVAIRMARRYTGKNKIINWYRSYHGGTANTLQATGDFRRNFGGENIPNFIKAFNPYPLFWDYAGDTEEERTQMALNMLEEQVLSEGPHTIALIQLESIVGTGGAIIPPKGYMQGVRAICDKYDILLHMDEVMMGFGRTGKMFGFQHFDGVIPDIVTGAKGLSSAAIPISMTACRKHIMDAFEEESLGWGSTYQAHPVAMTCAYENVKHIIKSDILGHIESLQPIFQEGMKTLAENHPSIKQYRQIGMFGCFDTHLPDGENPQLQAEAFAAYGKAYKKNGLIGIFRAPQLHVAPPLMISPEELWDGFERNDKALYTLDEALGFV